MSLPNRPFARTHVLSERTQHARLTGLEFRNNASDVAPSAAVRRVSRKLKQLICRGKFSVVSVMETWRAEFLFCACCNAPNLFVLSSGSVYNKLRHGFCRRLNVNENALYFFNLRAAMGVLVTGVFRCPKD